MSCEISVQQLKTSHDKEVFVRIKFERKQIINWEIKPFANLQFMAFKEMGHGLTGLQHRIYVHWNHLYSIKSNTRQSYKVTIM